MIYIYMMCVYIRTYIHTQYYMYAYCLFWKQLLIQEHDSFSSMEAIQHSKSNVLSMSILVMVDDHGGVAIHREVIHPRWWLFSMQYTYLNTCISHDNQLSVMHNRLNKSVTVISGMVGCTHNNSRAIWHVLTILCTLLVLL